MIRLRALQIFLLVVLGSLSVLAQTPQPAPKPTRDESATGAITGKVIDDRGQPLSGAIVFVRAIGSFNRAQNVSTDRDGAFNISGIERATYQVSASLPAYVPQAIDPSLPQNATYHVGDSVTLTMVKGGVITGTVTTLTGEPVVGVSVRVQMIRAMNGRRPVNNWNREKVTDDRGVYRIYGLPTGTYVVLAGGQTPYLSSSINVFDNDVPTYAPSSTRDNAAEVSVRAGEEIAGIDIRYRGEPGHVVSGQIVGSPELSPGGNITLTAAGDNAAPWSVSQFQQPNSRGFVFNAIADGDYFLVAQAFNANGERGLSASKRIKVRGADVTGVELTIKPLSSVAGRVVLEDSKAPECAGKPRPLFNEILVSAWHNETEAAKEVPPMVWSIGAPVPADADGGFVLHNLAPAEYYFLVRYAARYWYLQSMSFPPAPAANAKTPIKPVDATRVWTNLKPADKLTGLTITIAQGAASLRGTLALGEGEQVPSRLFVYLVPAERERAEDVLRYYVAPVTPEGKMTFNNLAPGRYWVLAQTVGDDVLAPFVKLRLPHETETRARVRREAEAAKNEIEFKPCQNVSDYKLPLKPPPQ